jgi:hypothetical protein
MFFEYGLILDKKQILKLYAKWFSNLKEWWIYSLEPTDPSFSEERILFKLIKVSISKTLS